MTTPIRDTDKNAHKFFNQLHDGTRIDDLGLVVVMHVVPGARIFLEHLERLARICIVLAKPNSQDEHERRYLSNRYTLKTLDKDQFQNSEFVSNLIGEHVRPGSYVIIDIGGYFARHLENLTGDPKVKLLGIVEDTENGHQRYADLTSFPVPVISAARSELKNSEDFLVGQSIVFAAERIMREYGSIMNGRRATVIGYGKIGKSIAQHLHSKYLSTVIRPYSP